MHDELSPLQQTVLERYEKLASSLHSLDDTLKSINSTDSEVSPEEVIRQLREIEIKIGLVGTLLKGSVYSFILQQKQEQERSNKQ
ncbi:hypothetical protein Kpol_1002p95 [Vanderwaltozyma polyspora DSM 70294]|uniref:DASH complex subunit DAD3 n=1 Tax=Vanderwaltozyma polyspora (strain ATCC 22028 / DSM 70294 / BCRC 21397 / CBS 2163 / NBRC 10782 / NRRL Y-8283 / UCD 57-17) TaxID=436907 RepID=A7TEC5_VANPO|nr:uncharacterized protein Kpol_1002p95 [Vanderwaltozyma polyspora DSM 70294]EDO19447.1 hypothetical protein Kpol_1002p95 [Vanderwaltozyma polyspora DSM 70294]